jgi:outer membrane receptor protein involved in Fe transport
VYHSLEPRLSTCFIINKNTSIKAGYARMSQHMQLLSNSFLVLPFNVWVPISENIKPLFSNNFTFGLYTNLLFDLNIVVEAFFKKINNDILYHNKIQSMSHTKTWENHIEQGERRAYGLEFNVKKTFGNMNGWFSYSLSKADRKFSSVNDGKFFPYFLVRTHRITSALHRNLTQNINIGINWVFTSGIPKNTKYIELDPVFYKQKQLSSHSENSERTDNWTLINNIPAYHRMDITTNFMKEKKHGTRTISLGIYNAYARNNPLLISENDGYLYLSKINMFLPFVQYSFKFKY